MGSIEELWPLFGLRLRIGDIELRLPSEADVTELAELTREPIHDPDVMPFSIGWTDASEDERARSTIQWHWRSRGEWRPDDWRLELVTVRDGTIVGTQGLHALQFGVTRQVESGSWVGRRFQGQGVGTSMRRAVLHLAFAGLGARTARSGAFEDNPASLRVSEKLGYCLDGSDTLVRRGQPGKMMRLLLTRERWEALSVEWPDVTIEGLESCLSLFGVAGG